MIGTNYRGPRGPQFSDGVKLTIFVVVGSILAIAALHHLKLMGL